MAWYNDMIIAPMCTTISKAMAEPSPTGANRVADIIMTWMTFSHQLWPPTVAADSAMMTASGGAPSATSSAK